MTDTLQPILSGLTAQSLNNPHELKERCACSSGAEAGGDSTRLQLQCDHRFSESGKQQGWLINRLQCDSVNAPS